jgi:general secretion pathway protein D
VIEDNAPPGGQQIVTQIFRLTHENANNLVPVLRPLISPNNTINVNPGNNSLVVTDYADNLRRIGPHHRRHGRVQRHRCGGDPPAARAGGRPGAAGAAPGRHRHGQPTRRRPGRLTPASARTVMLAEPRSNAMTGARCQPGTAGPGALADRKTRPPPAEGASGNIHVVYLKNADAVQTGHHPARGLSADSSPPPAAGTVAAATRTNTAAATRVLRPTRASTGGQIQADPATNALIITAPEPQYRQLRAVIDQLDARRAQVYVESLIAEVNADKAAEFGIQWQSAIGRAGRRPDRLAGHQLWHRRRQHHQPGHPERGGTGWPPPPG